MIPYLRLEVFKVEIDIEGTTTTTANELRIQHQMKQKTTIEKTEREEERGSKRPTMLLCVKLLCAKITRERERESDQTT